MGVDLESIPIRLDTPAVRRIREDPEAWNLAASYPPSGGRLRPGEALPEISRELRASFPPGMAWTWSFPDRGFEQAEYLLDPVAFGTHGSWERRERSIPLRVTQGDELFAKHATGRDLRSRPHMSRQRQWW